MSFQSKELLFCLICASVFLVTYMETRLNFSRILSLICGRLNVWWLSKKRLPHKGEASGIVRTTCVCRI